jgi:signal transduction histidine kinase
MKPGLLLLIILLIIILDFTVLYVFNSEMTSTKEYFKQNELMQMVKTSKKYLDVLFEQELKVEAKAGRNVVDYFYQKVKKGDITDTVALDSLKSYFDTKRYGKIGKVGYFALVSSKGNILIHPDTNWKEKNVYEMTIFQDTIIKFNNDSIVLNNKNFTIKGETFNIKNDTCIFKKNRFKLKDSLFIFNDDTIILHIRKFGKISQIAKEFEKTGIVKYYWDSKFKTAGLAYHPAFGGVFIWASAYNQADQIKLVKSDLLSPNLKDNKYKTDLFGSGYIFIISDDSAKELVHPYLEGIVAWEARDMKDSTKKFLQTIIKSVKEGVKSGYITYNWYKMDSILTRIVNLPDSNRLDSIKKVWNDPKDKSIAEKLAVWLHDPVSNYIYIGGFYTDEIKEYYDKSKEIGNKKSSFYGFQIILIIQIVIVILVIIIVSILYSRLRNENIAAKKASLKFRQLSNIGQKIVSFQNDSSSNNINFIEQLSENFFREIINSDFIDAKAFGIGLVDDESMKIIFPCVYEYNRVADKTEKIPPIQYDLNKDSNYPAINCFINQLTIKYPDKNTNNDYKNLIPKAGNFYTRWIYVPISYEKKKYGVISIQSDIKGEYDSNDLEVLRILSTYIANTLNNVEAHRRLRFTLENLQNISKEIVDQHDLSNSIKSFYLNIMGLIRNVHILSIGLFDKGKNELFFEGAIEIPNDQILEKIENEDDLQKYFLPSFYYKLSDINRPAVKCYNETKPGDHYYNPDYENYIIDNPEIEKPVLGKNARTVLYIPLDIKSEKDKDLHHKRIGVATIQSFNKNEYDKEDIDLFKSIANFFTIAADIFIKHKQLKDSTEKLIELEKHALIGKIFPEISHELNHPIHRARLASSAISNKTDSVIKLYKENEFTEQAFFDLLNDLKKRGNTITSNLRILVTYLDKYKSLAKDYKTTKEEHNIFEFVNSILDGFSYKLAKENVELKVNCPKDFYLTIYPHAIIQIFSNLLDNSIKYAWPSQFKNVKKTMNVNIIDEKDQIVFQILDNGCGISKDNLVQIFEPYYTTDFKKGTGLGLPIIKRIIEDELKGTIKVESELNKGFKFQFTHPKI